MSQRDDETRLRDMLDYSQRAIKTIRDRSRVDLDRDVVLSAALERFVEIIGEAATRVTEERRSLTPGIPWRQIIGMRNRLIHGYGTVDRDVLWDVVHDDLADLIAILQRELNK